MAEPSVPIDWATGRRFVRAVKVFLTSEVKGRARTLFALLFLCALAVNGLNVVNSYVGRDSMTAISQRDHQGFVRQAILYIGVFAASTAVAVMYRFIEERLGLFWRVWMTKRIVRRYLANRTSLWLKESASLQNSDQRIADDVRTFVATTLSFTLMSLNGVLAVLSFSGVLWAISPMLFVVAVLYAAVGSVGAIYVGLPLVRLNYRQADQEANFRADLIHVRENAESVALFRRERGLEERLRRRIDGLAENFRRITTVNRNLGFFTTGYNYLIQIIPTLIVAPMFIRGEVEFGVVTQSAMAFSQLLGAFSLVVNQVQSLSSFAAVTARLSALAEAVERQPTSPDADPGIGESGSTLEYRGVSLSSPEDGKPLLRNFSLAISRGTNVLVFGPIDAARVALFRATAGLARGVDGVVVRPNFDDLYFLPQRPYLPPGSLRDLVLGAASTSRSNEGQIEEVLRDVGVDRVITRVGGLDVEYDWMTLSLGDQQKLAVARVILARPAYAVLDRLKTSLSSEEARRIIDRLCRDGTACLSLAETIHDEDLFDAVVELNADGAWEMRTGLREVSPVRDSAQKL